MADIMLLRLMWTEILINGALIIANISLHIRARRLLKSADEIWREAIAYRQQAQALLDDASRRARR